MAAFPVIATGVITCPKCDWSGVVKIEVIEGGPPQLCAGFPDEGKVQEEELDSGAQPASVGRMAK